VCHIKCKQCYICCIQPLVLLMLTICDSLSGVDLEALVDQEAQSARCHNKHGTQIMVSHLAA
jgi:hypothetical protein